MNLETRLPPKLWEAVRTSYSNHNFSGAILDAVHFLGSLLRLKSGLDTDGIQLVGQALGGENPPVKLTKLQTETDRNIQRGIEHMVRGLYQAVRNPRSHERINDTESDADTLILFVGYVVSLVDKSKGIYSEEEALERIFDPHFVEQERYAELIVDEIPPKYRFEVLLSAFRRKHDGNAQKLRYAYHALISKLNEIERKSFSEVVTAELLSSNEEADLRSILEIVPADMWPSYGEAARLRAETTLITSMRSGAYDESKGKCRSGSLGTWTPRICTYLTLKNQYLYTITSLLGSEDAEKIAYVCKYLLPSLPRMESEPSWSIKTAIKLSLEQGHAGVKEYLDQLAYIDMYPDWAKHFEQERATFVPKKRPAGRFDDLDDDIPF